MNTIKLISTGMFFFLVMLASTASAGEKYSGYLDDYSKLIEVKDAKGETVMRYVSPDLIPGEYTKVMIDPVQFYPIPEPTNQVTEKVLKNISNYVDAGLKEKFEDKMEVVTEPGPGVLRIRPAITAVAVDTPSLKMYQLIPVAFIISSIRGRGKEAQISVEAEVVDSVTGERLGAMVRNGKGAKLANDKAELNVHDVKTLLDIWIDTGSAFILDGGNERQ